MNTTKTITELTILNRAYHYTLDLWAKEQQRADDFHAAGRPAPIAEACAERYWAKAEAIHAMILAAEAAERSC